MPTSAVDFLWMRATVRASLTSSTRRDHQMLGALFFEYPEDPVSCTVEGE
jgi:hypothetical protein